VDPRPGAGGPAHAARTGHRSRGLLTAGPRLPDRDHPLRERLRAGRLRATNPRFTGENFRRNLALADEVQEVATEVGATPAQIAIAWLLTKGQDVVPIPGTKRVSRVEENMAAEKVQLTAAQLRRLDELPAPSGGHHNEAQMAMIDR
jgi:aryl-alcohol dehydrogenase-like predicted oxidoreductase